MRNDSIYSKYQWMSLQKADYLQQKEFEHAQKSALESSLRNNKIRSAEETFAKTAFEIDSIIQKVVNRKMPDDDMDDLDYFHDNLEI